MIARLRDRWDGVFYEEGDDLIAIAKKVYGEDKNFGLRYAADPNCPEVAVITDKSPYGELVLAYVLATEEYQRV